MEKYYVEFVMKDLDMDPPYLMQSATFDSKREAENWFRKYFDYTSSDVEVRLMVMDFISEDEYEIGFIKTLN